MNEWTNRQIDHAIVYQYFLVHYHLVQYQNIMGFTINTALETELIKLRLNLPSTLPSLTRKYDRNITR